MNLKKIINRLGAAYNALFSKYYISITADKNLRANARWNMNKEGVWLLMDSVKQPIEDEENMAAIEKQVKDILL